MDSQIQHSHNLYSVRLGTCYALRGWAGTSCHWYQCVATTQLNTCLVSTPCVLFAESSVVSGGSVLRASRSRQQKQQLQQQKHQEVQQRQAEVEIAGSWLITRRFTFHQKTLQQTLGDLHHQHLLKVYMNMCLAVRAHTHQQHLRGLSSLHVKTSQGLQALLYRGACIDAHAE